jgi:hypothetical protein
MQEPHRRQISADITFSRKYKPEREAPYLDSTPLGLDLGIADLAMVNNDRVSTCTSRGLIGPTNALRELRIRVGEEKLSQSILSILSKERCGALTISSPRTRFAFPQALITKGSLKATTATMSTPFSRRFGRFLIYPGTWLTEQVGVKAPFQPPVRI